MDYTIDDEGWDPGDDEKGKERDADCETTPICGGDVGDNNVVHDVGSELGHAIEDITGSIGIDGLG
jgi:hypothetical protein